MGIYGCDNVRSKERVLRLFFYFTALFVMLIVLFALSGCSNDEPTDSSDTITSPMITFVPNNGNDEIIRDVSGKVPSLSKPGYYLSGWYADEDLTIRIDFETLTDIIQPQYASKFTEEGYKLYAKWQELKNMSGVRMRDTFFIYDGVSHNPEIEGLPSDAEVEFIGEGERVDAGEYEVTAVVKKFGYNDLSLSAKVTITKRKPDISGIKFEDRVVFWDDKSHSIEISGVLPDGISVSYENNGQKNLGVYEIVAKFDTGKNYESIADMTATLRIIANEYKITFVEEDGSIREVNVPAGENPTILEPKQKRGYIGKWSADNFNGEHGDMTVYARYELIRYGIEYECNGGGLSDNILLEYTVLDNVVLSAPTREHYEFCGWFQDAIFGGDRITEIAKDSIGDKKFYAKWVAKEYAITFETNGGVNNNGNSADGMKYVYSVESEDLILLSAEKQGYKFVRWIDALGNEVKVVESDNPKNQILYAEWEIIKYKIEYELNGGINDGSNPYEYTIEDVKINLQMPCRDKYVFKGWYESPNCSGENVCYIGGNWIRDVKLYAKWEEDIFRIQILNEKNIIVSYDYYFGKDVIIPAYVDGVKIDGVASGVFVGAESVKIEATLNEINVDLFEGCSTLKRLSLPDSLTSIPHGILKDCVNLEYLSIPFAGDRSVCEDGKYLPVASLFGIEENPNSYSVSVRPIYKEADGFTNCDISEIYQCFVPKSLKEIRISKGDILPFSFYEMKSVTSVVIDGDGEIIGASAFYGCVQLASITLPISLKEVKPSAFGDCVKLTEIILSAWTNIGVIQDAINRLTQEIEIKRY